MDFIFEKNISLNEKVCKSIISTFDQPTTIKYECRETNELKLNVKDEKWRIYDTILYNEIGKVIKEYIIYLDNKSDIFNLDEYNIRDNGFLIQKYNKNKGYCEYHNDSYNETKDCIRVLTYIWFLNTTTTGGEIEFWNGKYKIKPEIGKIIIFPSTWTYSYKQNYSPNDKYIIIGGIYKNI